MVQIPAATNVTVEPLTEQTAVVSELKVTALAEPPPVALTVNGGEPNVLSLNAPNVMIWSALSTFTDWVTLLAGENAPPPAWSAAMRKEPAPLAVTTVPEIEHGPEITEYVTGRPEL